MPSIYDLIPQPQMEQPETPIPLDESDRINELKKQLAALDPNVRTKTIDTFGLNRRSKSIDLGDGKATTGRSKGDWVNIIASMLTEGVKAAGGGDKYISPQERARAQFIEDYKIQSPKIIDELRILNQNKRASEALKSREEIEAMRITARNEVEQAREKLQRYAIDSRTGIQRSALEIKQEVANLTNKYRNVKDPQVLALLAQLQTDFSQMEKDPALAQKFNNEYSKLQTTNALTKQAAANFFKPTVNYNIVPTTQERDSLETGEKTQYRTDKIVKNTIPNSNMYSFLQDPKNFAQKFLTPTGQSVQPQTQPIQQTTPLQQPPATSNQPPSQPLAQPNKQPVIKPNTFARAPKATDIPGAVTTRPDTSAIDPNAEKSDFYSKKDEVLSKIPLDAESYIKPDSVEFKRVGAFIGKPAQKMIDDKIFDGYQVQDNGKIIKLGKDGQQIIIDPVFRGTRQERVKARKDFQTFRDATQALNSFSLATLRQYLTYDGNLFTGKGDLINAETALGWNNELRDKTLRKKGADLLTKKEFGRTPDGVDRWISLLSVESFLKKVYESTGKQISENELKLIRKTWLNDDLTPDVFLERLLTLTIKANRNLYDQYSHFEKGEAMSLGDLLNDTDNFATVRARAIIRNLKTKKTFNIKSLSPVH